MTRQQTIALIGIIILLFIVCQPRTPSPTMESIRDICREELGSSAHPDFADCVDYYAGVVAGAYER